MLLPGMTTHDCEITILYDNTTSSAALAAGRGFSCLVEAHGVNILFDTGADGKLLLYNMKKLGIDPSSPDKIFISHHHADHTGGLEDILAVKSADVYIPSSCPSPGKARKVVRVKEKLKVEGSIFSTGELYGVEQSLILETRKGVVVVAGCSHPGVRNILSAAYERGKLYGLIGGSTILKNSPCLNPCKWSVRLIVQPVFPR